MGARALCFLLFAETAKSDFTRQSLKSERRAVMPFDNVASREIRAGKSAMKHVLIGFDDARKIPLPSNFFECEFHFKSFAQANGKRTTHGGLAGKVREGNNPL